MKIRPMYLLRVLISTFLISFFSLPSSLGAAPASYAQETISDFDSALKSLKKERDALRREVDDLKVEHRSVLDSLELKMKDLEEERGRVGLALEESKVRIAAVEAEKQDLLEKIKDMQIRLDRFEEATSVKDSVFMQAKEENRSLKESLSQTESVLQRSADRIQKLQRAKEDIEVELKSSRARLEKVLFDQDDELLRIKKEREGMALQIKVLEVQAKAAEDQLKKRDTQESAAYKRSKEELKNLMSEQAVLKEKKAALQKKYDELLLASKKETADAVRRADTLAKKVSDLENRNEVAERMMTLADEKLKYYEGVIADLKKGRPAPASAGATDEVRKLKNELAAGQEMVERLKNELSSLSADYKGCLERSKELQLR